MDLLSRKVARLLQPVALSLCFVLSQSVSADAAQLTLVPDQPLSGLSIGDSFSISLLFDDEGGPALTSFRTNLSFDDTIIDYTSTSFNPNFGGKEQGADNLFGFQVLAVTGSSEPPFFGRYVTGSGTLVAQFFFDVIGTGSTSLDFTPTLTYFGLLEITIPDPEELPTVDITGPSSFAVSVPAAPVPLPASSLLLGAALAGLGVAAKRRARHS